MVGEAFCLGSGVFPIRDRLSDLRWTCFVIGDTSSVSSYAGFSLQSGEEDEAMEWNGIVGECCFGVAVVVGSVVETGIGNSSNISVLLSR